MDIEVGPSHQNGWFLGVVWQVGMKIEKLRRDLGYNFGGVCLEGHLGKGMRIVKKEDLSLSLFVK